MPDGGLVLVTETGTDQGTETDVLRLTPAGTLLH